MGDRLNESFAYPTLFRTDDFNLRSPTRSRRAREWIRRLLRGLGLPATRSGQARADRLLVGKKTVLGESRFPATTVR